jgi:large subunit ribosomal protein L23
VVDPKTTKTQVKKAVEKIFGVKVVKVNTLNRKGKTFRTRFGIGKRKDIKHAIVILAKGQTIDVFGAQG